MKRFTIPCDFAGQKAPFHIYVGEPEPDIHPLFFQSAWLSEKRGGAIPVEVMESFSKLHTIAKENGVSFEELCVYALGTAQQSPAPAAAEESPSPVAENAPVPQDGASKESTENVEHSAPNIPVKYASESAAERTVTILLVRGSDPQSNPIYAYVAVRADKVPAFMEAQKTDTFHPEDFGVIVEQGLGEPSADVRAKMEKEYGFNHGAMVAIPDSSAAARLVHGIEENAGTRD